MTKNCRCGGTKVDTSYSHEVELDKIVIRVPPIPAKVCSKCRDITIPLVELGRCEQKAAASALCSDQIVSGSAMRYGRRALGFSREALAVKLNLTPEDVENWETGEAEVDHLSQLALSALLAEAAQA